MTTRTPVRSSLWLGLLAVPAVVFFLVFSYAPMAGLVVAFKEFDVSKGIFGSPWNGLDNFRYFFDLRGRARILFNTIFLNVLFLAATLAAGITLAIMLNEIRGRFFKRAAQSAVFFPYFVSPVVISIMLQVLLAGAAGGGGAVNDALTGFGLPTVDWYTEPGPWPWILTLVKVWQLGGYMSVIFLAAITCDPRGGLRGRHDRRRESRAQMAWRITLPLLKPTAAVLLVPRCRPDLLRRLRHHLRDRRGQRHAVPDHRRDRHLRLPVPAPARRLRHHRRDRPVPVGGRLHPGGDRGADPAPVLQGDSAVTTMTSMSRHGGGTLEPFTVFSIIGVGLSVLVCPSRSG